MTKDLFVNFKDRISAELDPPYVYSEELLRAVKVAGVIERVLLVRGAPGTGKSTLAANIAAALGWEYLQTVITSRTEARDLLWSFDHVERLNDAYASTAEQKQRVVQKAEYIVPGVLWRAFEPTLKLLKKPPPQSAPKPGVVVLIDEIDKADPDFANDLLVPLEKREFTCDALDHADAVVNRTVQCTRPVFVIVSTNEERELPQAFLRRCVVIELKRPHERAVLRDIATRHGLDPNDVYFGNVFDAYCQLGEQAEEHDLRAPGTAEFLDALRACEALQPTGSELTLVLNAALWKHDASSLA